MGLTNLRAAGAHTQWFAVSRLILHPTYQMWHPVGGDVALVQLQSRIEFSDAVGPVCLPPPTLQLDNSSACWVTGWGLVSQQGEHGWGTWSLGCCGCRWGGGFGLRLLVLLGTAACQQPGPSAGLPLVGWEWG